MHYRRVLRTNSTSSSSTHSTVKSRGQAEPLTVVHFNQLMQSIQAMSLDISEIKTTQNSIRMELHEVNAKLAEHSEAISGHSNSIAECRSELTNHSHAISGCQSALESLKTSYSLLVERVGHIETLPPPSPSSGDQETVRESTYPATTLSAADADEKLERSHNLIIYALPESTDDGNHVKALMDTILPHSSQAILSISRIGSADRHPGKPRLLRVTFNNIITPKTLLRNKSALLSSDFKNIIIRDDKTLRELRLLDNLRKQLRVRQAAGEKNITIKYVRGQPTIVQTSSKN